MSYIFPVLKHCLGSWLCFAISQHTKPALISSYPRTDHKNGQSVCTSFWFTKKTNIFSIDTPLDRDVIDDSGIETHSNPLVSPKLLSHDLIAPKIKTSQENGNGDGGLVRSPMSATSAQVQILKHQMHTKMIE